MTWTRREFLAASTLAVAGGVVGRSRTLRGWQTAPPPPLNPVFTPIRRNMGFFTARGGTIGYLINPTGVVVVDSQYPDSGKLCVQGLGERSGGRPIDVLINTHHHADHTGGNIAFKATTRKIVAQANVPDLQRDAAAKATQQVEQVYADTTFGYTWKATIGDETIAAEFYAPAHTGGDAIVHFEQANVVHVGDLVWNRLQTFVDRPGGASAVNWIKMLEKIASTYPADAVFIVGHAGPQFPVACTRAEVLMMRDYMTALVEYVRTAIKGGAPRDSVIRSTEVLRGFEAFGPLTTRALTGTYDELATR